MADDVAGGRCGPCGHEGQGEGGAGTGRAASRAPLVRRSGDTREDAGGQGGVREHLSAMRAGEPVTFFGPPMLTILRGVAYHSRVL